MKKSYLIHFTLGIGFCLMASTSCEKAEFSIGVCEVKSHETDYELNTYDIYYCIHGLAAQGICEDKRTATYYGENSCEDLGYTKANHFTNELTTVKGSKIPGSNGAYSHEYSGGTGGGSGNGETGITYSWSYTCPGDYGSGGEIEIAEGACEDSQKKMAKTFGCNDIDNFKSACISYYSCIGASTDYCSRY